MIVCRVSCIITCVTHMSTIQVYAGRLNRIFSVNKHHIEPTRIHLIKEMSHSDSHAGPPKERSSAERRYKMLSHHFPSR